MESGVNFKRGLVFFLMFLTVLLAAGASFVGWRLSQVDDTTPDETEAATTGSCSPTSKYHCGSDGGCGTATWGNLCEWDGAFKGSCVLADACAPQVQEGAPCSGNYYQSGTRIYRFGTGESSRGSFVGCSGVRNCFCSQNVGVGGTFTSGNVVCYDDIPLNGYVDSCGLNFRPAPPPFSGPTINPPTSTPPPGQCIDPPNLNIRINNSGGWVKPSTISSTRPIPFEVDANCFRGSTGTASTEQVMRVYFNGSQIAGGSNFTAENIQVNQTGTWEFRCTDRNYPTVPFCNETGSFTITSNQQPSPTTVPPTATPTVTPTGTIPPTATPTVTPTGTIPPSPTPPVTIPSIPKTSLESDDTIYLVIAAVMVSLGMYLVLGTNYINLSLQKVSSLYISRFSKEARFEKSKEKFEKQMEE